MIIIENGEVTIVPDLPSNYHCKEWKDYDQACDRAQAAGEHWTEEQATTYATYYQARENNSFTPTIVGRVLGLFRKIG